LGTTDYMKNYPSGYLPDCWYYYYAWYYFVYGYV